MLFFNGLIKIEGKKQRLRKFIKSIEEVEKTLHSVKRRKENKKEGCLRKDEIFHIPYRIYIKYF